MTSLSWAAEMKWNGDYRLRGFFTNNLTDQNNNSQDSAAYYSSRFLLTAAATDENVSGVATLILGNTNGTGNRLLGEVPYGPEANDGSGTSIGLLEAYIRADFAALNFKGGRQVFKLGNGIILEDAMDGLLANSNLGPAALTLGTFKIVEKTQTGLVAIGNSPTPGHTGDADLYVINTGFGNQMTPVRDLNLFAAYLVDRSGTLIGGGADPDDQLTLLTLGALAAADLGAIHLKSEVDFLTGKQTLGPVSTKSDLGGFNAIVGFKLETKMPLGLDLIYASGQDPTSNDRNVNGLDGNYPVGIIITNGGARSLAPKDGTCLSINGSSLGGVPNCIGGAGLTAVKLSTGMKVEQLNLDLAGIWAKSTEKPIVNGKTDIGIELDVTATYPLTQRLSLLGGAGYLLAGKFFGNNPDNMTVLVSQISYTF
jgi:hypothetical protein